MLKNSAVSDTGSGHSEVGLVSTLNLITGGSQPSGALTQELLTCLAPRSASSRFPCNELGHESFSLDA